MATAENPTLCKTTFQHVIGHGSLRFWHASRYWIYLTCLIMITGHRAPEQHYGALAVFAERRVTRSKGAVDSTTKPNTEAGSFSVPCVFQIMVLCKNIDEGSTITIWGRHLISETNITPHLKLFTHHKQIYNITKRICGVHQFKRNNSNMEH